MLFCLVVLAEQVQCEAQCKDFLLENQTILIAFVCFILKRQYTDIRVLNCIQWPLYLPDY